MTGRKANKTVSEPGIPRYRICFAGIIAFLCLAGIFYARLHIEQLTGASRLLFANTNGLYADWFLSCKETFYLLLAIGVCAYAVGERIFPDTVCRVNPLYRRSALLPGICIGGWFLLSVLSCLFSDNKEVVMRGTCTEYEGLSAVFSYGVLFLFGFNFLSSDRILSVLQRILLLFGAISAALAFIEYVGQPLCENPIIRHLVAPPQYREMAESLKSANTFHEAVLMFHNSNYAGVFFVLMLPFPFSEMLSQKSIAVRMASSVLCAALLAAGIMTNATAAFYVMLAELLFLIIFLLSRHILKFRIFLLSCGIVLVLLTGVDFCANHTFSVTLLKSMTNAETYSADSVYHIKKAEIQGQSLHLSGNGSGYLVTPPYTAREVIQIHPDSGTACEIVEKTSNHFVISDTASGTRIQADVQNGILYVDIGCTSTLDFTVTADGLHLIAQNGILLSEIPQAPMADSPLSQYNSLFTGRGYIWLNSLPILKKCLILGKGMGNFPFYFVQNDVAGLCNTNGTYHLMIDKPHSMYLQTAVTAGIPALLLLLLLFGSFLFYGIRSLCSAKQEQFRESIRLRMLLCLYVSTAGYMVSSLVNDSCIAVSPIFWLLLGTAYSLSECGSIAVNINKGVFL